VGAAEETEYSIDAGDGCGDEDVVGHNGVAYTVMRQDVGDESVSMLARAGRGLAPNSVRMGIQVLPL
jgi:hypothetical protein